MTSLACLDALQAPAAKHILHSFDRDESESCQFFREYWGPKKGYSEATGHLPKGDRVWPMMNKTVWDEERKQHALNLAFTLRSPVSLSPYEFSQFTSSQVVPLGKKTLTTNSRV